MDGRSAGCELGRSEDDCSEKAGGVRVRRGVSSRSARRVVELPRASCPVLWTPLDSLLPQVNQCLILSLQRCRRFSCLVFIFSRVSLASGVVVMA